MVQNMFYFMTLTFIFTLSSIGAWRLIKPPNFFVIQVDMRLLGGDPCPQIDFCRFLGHDGKPPSVYSGYHHVKENSSLKAIDVIVFPLFQLPDVSTVFLQPGAVLMLFGQ